MPTPQSEEQKRKAKEYEAYVKKKTPTHSLLLNMAGAFIMGGLICVAGQVILNICVVLNWIPTTGITLPFFSYGGTSIMFLMAEMGIALSVSREIKFAK